MAWVCLRSHEMNTSLIMQFTKLTDLAAAIGKVEAVSASRMSEVFELQVMHGNLYAESN